MALYRVMLNVFDSIDLLSPEMRCFKIIFLLFEITILVLFGLENAFSGELSIRFGIDLDLRV